MEVVTRTVLATYAHGASEKINHYKSHLEQSAAGSRFEIQTAEG
jgi:hypothetical protein